MTTVAIPDWNTQGIIPPIFAIDPSSAERSPYRVALTDFMLRFGTSPKRRVILDGLLRFRVALHQIGLTSGFQWLDGSFLEDIEHIEYRDPGDIDIVTFFRLPKDETQESLVKHQSNLFNPSQTKADYHVDGYFVHLFPQKPELLIQKATYWYSMWSHRRDSIWKGYVQIDLSQDDAAARESLDALAKEEDQS